MSEEIQAAAPEVQPTAIENTGGPRIPNAGNPAKIPGQPAAAPQPVAKQPFTGLAPAAEPAQPASEGTSEPDAAALALGDLAAPTSESAQETSLETGNAIIDAGIAMLQKTAGLNQQDVDRALGNALKFNNPELIDKAFLQERFKDNAALAESLCSAFFKEAQNASTQLVQDIYKAAGGEQAWVGLRDSFKAAAPEYQKAAARALFDAGKVQEGVSLITDYCRGQGLAVTQGSQVKGQAGLAGAALSASEFSAEFAKLRQTAGNRSLASGPFAAQYNSLLQRRQAGKAIGR